MHKKKKKQTPELPSLNPIKVYVLLVYHIKTGKCIITINWKLYRILKEEQNTQGGIQLWVGKAGLNISNKISM